MNLLKKNQMLKLKRIENSLWFLTLLFLPTQLGKHLWPEFAYIYSLKIDYLSPTLYFWDILVIGLLVIWFCQKPHINKLALNLLLLFLFTQALSLMGAQNLGAGLVRLEQYTVAGFFGVFLASGDFKSLSKKILLPLSLGIVGESAIALLQFLKGSTLGLWVLGERAFTLSTPGIAKFDFYGYQFLRPYATFPHPNLLAAYILIGVGIMYLVLREKQRVSRLSLMLGCLAVFLSMSRVAILAGFIALTVLRRKWLTAIIVITLMLSPILFTRFTSLFNFDSLTLLRREELMGSAWQMFLAKPVFGVGLNNFVPVSAGDLLTGPSRFLQPVHNIILLVLSETGIIGLAGFLLFISYPIKKLIVGRVSPVALVLWFMILFLGMFDHYFLTLPQGYRLFFLVWGLSLSFL